jgi:hypothetical protein
VLAAPSAGTIKQTERQRGSKNRREQNKTEETNASVEKSIQENISSNNVEGKEVTLYHHNNIRQKVTTKNSYFDLNNIIRTSVRGCQWSPCSDRADEEGGGE